MNKKQKQIVGDVAIVLSALSAAVMVIKSIKGMFDDHKLNIKQMETLEAQRQAQVAIKESIDGKPHNPFKQQIDSSIN